MKKCLGILLLLAVGVLPIHSASAYTFNEYNMVFNGDAEWGYDFYYWGPAAQVGGAVILNRVDEPNACFQLSVTSGVDDRAWLYQGILQDVVPGEPLQLKFRYKTLPGFVMGSASGLVVKIHYYNISGGGVTEQGFSLATTDGAWVEVTQLITVPTDATIRRADIGMEMKYWDTGTTEGTVRFDDIQLYNTAVYGGNEIQNGDAEDSNFANYKEALNAVIISIDNTTPSGTYCFEMDSTTDPDPNKTRINAFCTNFYDGFQYSDCAVLKFSYKTLPGFVLGANAHALTVQPRSFDGGSFKGEDNIDLPVTNGEWKTVVFAFKIKDDSSVESLDVRISMNNFAGGGCNGVIRFDDIQVVQRVRSFFWRNDITSGSFFNSDNWTTDSDSNATSPNYGWTHKVWSDTARIQPTNGASVDIALTEANMVGGIWRHAADDGKEYDMLISGATGSINVTRSLGLTYNNNTDGYVDFQSGTINVTGDGGNKLVPTTNDSGYFKIAHRGTATLDIRNGATLNLLGGSGSDMWIAGSGNSANNYGSLTVAGTLNAGPRAIHVAQWGGNDTSTANLGIEGRLVIEPGAVITTGAIRGAGNPNMRAVIDINSGTILDLNTPSRTIQNLTVARHGIGIMNVKPNALVKVGRDNFWLTQDDGAGDANGTLNVEGTVEFPGQTMQDIARAHHTGTLNVKNGGIVTGNKLYGAAWANSHAYLNVASGGRIDLASYFMPADAGTAVFNFESGSIVNCGRMLGARNGASVATINSRGAFTCTGYVGAASDTTGLGTLNILSGNFNMPGQTLYASYGSGNGVINISGGEVSVTTLMGTKTNGGNGTINISGGTVLAQKTQVAAAAGSTCNFNVTGGLFDGAGLYYFTVAEKGNANLAMTGGKLNLNRIVVANYGNSVGNATITGGEVDVYGRLIVAQQANSVGTLTIGGTADVNVSDIDYTNYSVGIMIGQIEGKGDPTYTPPFLSAGNGTMILDGSNATVKTSYLTLGGRVYAQDGIQWNNYDAGPSQLQFKLDGVHGVGSGIYATKEVQLSDGPAANTGIVASFNGTPAVGIYTVIRTEDVIDVNESFSAQNLMMGAAGWSYKVVTAGDEQRLKLFYCDLGNNECYVDFRCFAAFAAQWVDGNADGYDLAYLATNWLKKFSTF